MSWCYQTGLKSVHSEGGLAVGPEAPYLFSFFFGPSRITMLVNIRLGPIAPQLGIGTNDTTHILPSPDTPEHQGRRPIWGKLQLREGASVQRGMQKTREKAVASGRIYLTLYFSPSHSFSI